MLAELREIPDILLNKEKEGSKKLSEVSEFFQKKNFFQLPKSWQKKQGLTSPDVKSFLSLLRAPRSPAAGWSTGRGGGAAAGGARGCGGGGFTGGAEAPKKRGGAGAAKKTYVFFF